MTSTTLNYPRTLEVLVTKNSGGVTQLSVCQIICHRLKVKNGNLENHGPETFYRKLGAAEYIVALWRDALTCIYNC